MKTLSLSLIALALSATAAHADGFVCSAGDLNIQVYNNTDANEGTRNGAVMILSDETIGYGKKTIARFTDLNSTLSNQGSRFVAQVDLRFADSRLGGRNIGGTKLMYLDQIVLDVGFSYSRPVEDGTELPAAIHFVKRNGEYDTLNALCIRYLKN